MQTPLPRGVFTLSLNFELAWGSRDLVDDASGLERMSVITRESVFEPLIALFERHGLVGTWATVGHLFLDRAERVDGRLHPDHPRPAHTWRPDWLAGVPAGDERTAPAWVGRSLVERLRDAGQEIGSHAFTHVIFGDPGCSEAVADAELARCVREAEALGIPLRSFVFPRNEPGHLHLLRKHGFTSWRGHEAAWWRRPGLPRPLMRGGHMVDVVTGRRAPPAVPTRGPDGLWNLPASCVFSPVDGARRFIPMRQRVRRAVTGIDAAARRRGLCHLYIHPINFATDPPRMLRGLDAVLRHAAELRDQGQLELLSMGALAERLDAA